MILACDEDVGAGVPSALKLLGLSTVLSIPQQGHYGQTDIEWLATAGKKGWLVFSFNKNMLLVPLERDAIVSNKVGIVFLTRGQERPHEVMRFLLNRWGWLEEIDQTIPRAFAYEVSMKGKPRKVL